MRVIAGAVLLAVSAVAPALADDGPWIKPLRYTVADGITVNLPVDVNLTGFDSSQSGSAGMTGATASVFVSPKIEKLFANEWRVGFASELDLYHDRFSGDRYGDRVFAKAYGFVRTPLGDVEIGQQDGAAYKMAITGPVIAPAAAIDDGTISFFRDPSTGQNLRTIFDARTAVFATGNDAKLSYYSPRLIGLQIGISFTPQLVRGVLPFAQSAQAVSNRQENLLDAAINYIDSFGNTTVALYGGLSSGHNAARTPGHDNLLDWALGGEVDEDLGESTLALGGAYRQSNAYDFDPFNAVAQGTSRAVHVSATWSAGAWKAGLEYSNGAADAALGLSSIGFTGYAVTGAYAVNSNLQLTVGWQHERFARDAAFYTGTDALGMDAVYLYAAIHV